MNTTNAATADAWTDQQYLQHLAEHYADSPVPEIRAHRERLLAIAAALASTAAQPPEWWVMGQRITEEMHVAACKVLQRANGLDGLPQRMLDAMLAAAPKAEPMSWNTGNTAAPAAVAPQAPAQAAPAAVLPEGWTPLTITHAGQHPEEVAYGPQIMMDRLRKWLDRYFATLAAPAAAAWPAELHDILMHVVCDTRNPERQIQASRMIEAMQRAQPAVAPAAPAAVAGLSERLRDELVDLARSIVALYKERSTVLQVHVENMADLLEELAAAPATQAAPAISAGDAVFAFTSMLTALPRVVPFGAAAWATPGVELATAFNAANGFCVSQNFPDGLVFPKIDGDLLAVVEKAAAPQPAAPQEPILKVFKGEISYKSKADDQSYGMWCPVYPSSDHGLPDGAELYAAQPQEAAPVAQGDALTQAARDVLAERQRQISAEGWTPEHDDEHDDGSLASAAACYAMAGAYRHYEPREKWRWDDSWWKPSTDKRRNLEKAGALILAEMERLDRAASRSQAKEGGAA